MSSVTEQFVVVLFSGWLIGVGVKLVLRNKQGGVSVEFDLWGGRMFVRCGVDWVEGALYDVCGIWGSSTASRWVVVRVVKSVL